MLSCEFPCCGINKGLHLFCSIQLRYGFIWSAMVGRAIGSPMEMELLDNERIIQVSGAVVLQLYDFWQEFEFDVCKIY